MAQCGSTVNLEWFEKHGAEPNKFLWDLSHTTCQQIKLLRIIHNRLTMGVDVENSNQAARKICVCVYSQSGLYPMYSLSISKYPPKPRTKSLLLPRTIFLIILLLDIVSTHHLQKYLIQRCLTDRIILQAQLLFIILQ